MERFVVNNNDGSCLFSCLELLLVHRVSWLPDPVVIHWTIKQCSMVWLDRNRIEINPIEIVSVNTWVFFGWGTPVVTEKLGLTSLLSEVPFPESGIGWRVIPRQGVNPLWIGNEINLLQISIHQSFKDWHTSIRCGLEQICTECSIFTWSIVMSAKDES